MKKTGKAKRYMSSALALTLAVGTMVVSGQVAKGATSNYDYGEAFQKTLMFYEFQKSGKLPENQRNNWRGDSGMNDGADVGHDLTGGWYDCGDHIKFNLPMAYTSTMLAWSYLESKDAYVKSGQEKYLLDEIKWANDYFIKCHTAPDEYYFQVGDDNDHSFWGAAEILQMKRPAFKVDLDNPGSAVCAEGAASLASCSMIFKDKDPAYAEKCLSHAKQLLSLAERMNGDSGYAKAAKGFYKSSHFYDDLSWANMWMYLATKDTSYMEKAKQFSKNWGKQDQTDEFAYTWAHCWDDVHYGAELLIAMNDKTADAAKFKKAIENNLDYWTIGKDGERIKYTPKGLAWRDQWGSLRYAADQGFLASIYADWDKADPNRAEAYQNFAKSQADYILGSTGHSYIVGCGENYSYKTHHRTAHGSWVNNCSAEPTTPRHLLIGAMVGGPGSNDDYEDTIPDYIKNEVGCDYNAAAHCLMSKMYEDYGGTIDKDLNAMEEVGEELFIDAGVNAHDDQNVVNFVEMKAVIENRTAWPARVTDKLSFRYFVDISDVLAQGHSADEMQITTNYSQHPVKVSKLKPWDTKNGIYYVDIDLSGAKIYPGGQSEHKCEVQFRISAPGKWDYKKSPSYKGLEQAGSNNLVRAENMALYDNGKLVFGKEPGQEGREDVYDPAVNLTEPKDGAVFENVTNDNPIMIKADASVEKSKISKVEFYVDGEKVSEDLTQPYEMKFVPSESKTYTLTAKAYAENGRSTVSKEVKVTAKQPEKEKPQVSVETPVNGTIVDMSEGIQDIELTAKADIKQGNISKVIYYVNGQKAGESNKAPYQVNFKPEGTADKKGELTTYEIKAEAYADNGTKSTSQPVEVKVQLPVLEAPVIDIVSPEDGEKFVEVVDKIQVRAAASVLGDEVEKVEFYADGKKFAQAEEAEDGYYKADYKVEGTATEEGQLTPVEFTAKAVSRHGKETTSKKITVHVQYKVQEHGDSELQVTNTGSHEQSTNTLTNNFKLFYKEGAPLDLSRLSIRYYYTADGSQNQTVWCDHAAAQMNKDPWYVSYTGSVKGNTVAMESASDYADSYIEIVFDSDDKLEAGATLEVNTRTAKEDWSDYDQSNDFSYGDSNKVAVYYDGQLIAGVTP